MMPMTAPLLIELLTEELPPKALKKLGEAFAQAIQLDPLRGPGEELNEAADAALAQFPFLDRARQAAGGGRTWGAHRWCRSGAPRGRG